MHVDKNTMNPEMPPITTDWSSLGLFSKHLGVFNDNLSGGAEEGDGSIGDQGAHGAVDHLANRDDVTVEAVAQHQPHPGSSEGVQQRLSGRLGRLQPPGSLDSERARRVHGKVSPPEEAIQKIG